MHPPHHPPRDAHRSACRPARGFGTGGACWLRLLLTVVLALLVPLAGARPTAAAQAEQVVVIAALSGSVIAVRDADGSISPVHYLGVEAPAGGQRFHEEAREANAARVVGKPVL